MSETPGGVPWTNGQEFMGFGPWGDTYKLYVQINKNQ